MTEVGRVSVRVTPDTEGFRSALRRQLEKEARDEKTPVNLDLDTGAAAAKLKAFQAAMRNTEIKAKADFDTGFTKVKFDKLMATLRAEAARDIKIKVDLDRSSLDRVTNSLGQGLSKIGDKVAGVFDGKSGGGGLGGLGSFADTAALVAAVAALAAPALALISGLVTTLPAALATLLVPIGAVALGLDGLKKAAEVLAPDLAALKATMSQRFQDVFTPILTKLRDVFPVLAASLPAVADSLGKVAQSVVDTVTSASGLDRIKNTIGNIAKTISDSAPGVGSFTNGLLSLADRVSAKFPAVADWFSKAGDAFTKWVDKMSTVDASGTSPLDRAMGNLGETLKGILDIGGDLLKQGFDFLADPKFGESMKAFVADVKDLVNNVLPGLKNFFIDIAGSVHDLNSIIDKISTFKPPSWVPQGKDPASAKGNGGFDGATIRPDSFLGNIVGHNPFEETQNSWNAMIATFQAGFSVMWVGLKQVATTAITEIAAGASAILSGIWTGVTSVAASAWSGIVGIVTNVVAQVGSVLAQVPTALQGAWASLSGIAAQAWNTVVSTVASVMSQVVAAVVSGGGQVVSEVASWPGKIAGALAGLAAEGAKAGAALVQGLINGIGSMIGAAISAAAGLASRVAAAAKSALGIHSPSKVFFDIGDNVGQGLANGIEGQTSNVVSTIKEILQAIKDVFGNASGLALNFNLGGSGGLPTQMASVADSAASFNKSMTGSLPAVGKVSSETKAQVDQLRLQQQQIDVDKQQLQIQKNGAGKGAKAGIQQQIDSLNLQRQQLDVQIQQMQMADKYGGQLDQQNQQYTDLLKKTSQMPIDFAKANASQLMQDLGMSGNGAIPTIAGEFVDWGSGLVQNFYTSSVDETIAVKNNQLNKQSLQWKDRQ